MVGPARLILFVSYAFSSSCTCLSHAAKLRTMENELLHLRQMVASNERPHGCGGVRTELPQHELQSMVGHFYTMHTYSHIFIFSMFLVYATLCTDVKRISNLLLLYSLLPFLSFLPRFRRSGMRAFVIGMQTTRPTRTSSTYVLILSAMCKWSDLYQLAEDWGLLMMRRGRRCLSWPRQQPGD